MKINFTLGTMLVFVALQFFLGEAHELAHTGVGRVLCGCWGPRDFNVWELCKICAVSEPWSVLPTFIGPLFTYAVMWVGYVLLAPARPVAQQSLGFALVLAPLPAARMLGIATGGQDEIYGLTSFMPHGTAWVLGGALMLAIMLPPLVRAFRALRHRGRVTVFLGFFLLPTVLSLLVILGGLNSLLAGGLLAGPGLLGSPLLVNAWTVLLSLVLALTYQRLYVLGVPAAVGEPVVAAQG